MLPCEYSSRDTLVAVRALVVHLEPLVGARLVDDVSLRARALSDVVVLGKVNRTDGAASVTARLNVAALRGSCLTDRSVDSAASLGIVERLNLCARGGQDADATDHAADEGED